MNKFVFIDESGVLANDPNQPFFGIGLLKIYDTTLLYQKVKNVKDKLISREFKFSNVNRGNLSLYLELLDAYFSYSNCYFCLFVLDKFNPNVQIKQYFSNVWDAYIGYSKLLLRNNIGEDTCCVISDYLDRPRYAHNSYEQSIRSIGPRIFNATMLESHACLMIQVVDVLTGCVLYDFRQERYPSGISNRPKLELSNRLKEILGVNRLCQNFTVHLPNYFSVWEFKPN